MTYSDLFINKSRQKIPTVVLVLVVLLMGVFMARIFATKPLTSRASKKTLKILNVVNLSYNQATVFWQTDAKESSWLIYGENENKLDQIALDERDTVEKKGSYLNHYAILRNLGQNRQYFFKIVSDNQLIADPEGKAYKFETTANIPSASNISPAYGKIINPNGEPLTSGVVILTFKNSYALFSLVKLSGEWMIPLNNLLDSTTKKPKNVSKDETGLIEIYSEDGLKTSIEISAANLSPIPQTVVIGKDYSFLTKDSVLGLTTGEKKVGKIEILYPKENAIIASEKPLIKGLAIPGSEILVNLKSRLSYATRTIADKEGLWKVVLNERLPAERYEMKISTKNEKGEQINLTRFFTIGKSGEQVLGDATPEPTLVDSPTPEPTQIIASSTPVPTIKQAGFDPLPLSIISGTLITIGIGIILAF